MLSATRASALLVLAASVAHARDLGELTVAGRGGAVFPQPFSSLSTSFLCGAEVGWVLPFWARHLAIAFDVAVSAPEADGTGTQPSAAPFSWHVVAREVSIGLYLFVRHAFGRVMPYLGAGPRLLVVDTLVSGAAGTDRLVPAHETTVAAGGGLVPGLGVTVGAGQIFVELPLAFAQATERTTGQVSTSSVGLAFGYRVSFK